MGICVGGPRQRPASGGRSPPSSGLSQDSQSLDAPGYAEQQGRSSLAGQLRVPGLLLLAREAGRWEQGFQQLASCASLNLSPTFSSFQRLSEDPPLSLTAGIRDGAAAWPGRPAVGGLLAVLLGSMLACLRDQLVARRQEAEVSDSSLAPPVTCS